MEFKAYLKRNRFFSLLIPVVRRLQYHYLYPLVFAWRRLLRTSGWNCPSLYQRMKDYKDRHRGQRCFIIATGPSLTHEDLEKLKGEVTFSMNSICMAFDEVAYRPTYYGIQDYFVYEKLMDRIFQGDLGQLFISDVIARRYPVPEGSVLFGHNLLNHQYPHKTYNTRFSEDCFKQVYDGYTITYSLIQIAVYMGFKEIYLLGADNVYTKTSGHFKEHGVIDSSYQEAGRRMTEAYKVARGYADRHGIKICNATRGGMLEVFPRVNLDHVLGLQEQPYGPT